jgi:hypothetical protein
MKFKRAFEDEVISTECSSKDVWVELLPSVSGTAVQNPETLGVEVTPMTSWNAFSHLLYGDPPLPPLPPSSLPLPLSSASRYNPANSHIQLCALYETLVVVDLLPSPSGNAVPNPETLGVEVNLMTKTQALYPLNRAETPRTAITSDISILGNFKRPKLSNFDAHGHGAVTTLETLWRTHVKSIVDSEDPGIGVESLKPFPNPPCPKPYSLWETAQQGTTLDPLKACSHKT